jgi:hypothetical protein
VRIRNECFALPGPLDRPSPAMPSTWRPDAALPTRGLDLVWLGVWRRGARDSGIDRGSSAAMGRCIAGGSAGPLARRHCKLDMFHFCSYDRRYPQSAIAIAQLLDLSCLSHLIAVLVGRPVHASVFPQQRHGASPLQGVRSVLMATLETFPALPVTGARWPTGGVVLARLSVLLCIGSLRRQPASRPCAAT